MQSQYSQKALNAAAPHPVKRLGQSFLGPRGGKLSENAGILGDASVDDLQLLMDLHLPGERQGPGSVAMTQRALEMAGLRDRGPLAIAEIGCGTGAAALTLARDLDARITAVDLFPAFLTTLQARAAEQDLAAKITTLEASMDALPFAAASYDVLWSEGAVYNMGFAKGVTEWRRFLKPGGWLCVSEITWLTRQRPEELNTFWQQAYPEIDTAAAKMAVLEQAGYTPRGYFALPESCWLDGYYRPLQVRFPVFLDQQQHSEAAKALVKAEKAEIELYEKYRKYYSYGFYIAQKVEI